MFVEKGPSGICRGREWGHLLTSLLLQGPSGELHLLMQRKVLGLLLLQPSLAREALLPPYLTVTQGTLPIAHS